MKKKICIVVVLLLVVLFLGFGICRCVYLLPFTYQDSETLDRETNDTIKELVLNAVKDRCSSLYETNKSNIYDLSHKEDIIQLYDAKKGSHLIVLINSDFMHTVTGSNGVYEGFLHTYFMEDVSEDCNYHFRVEETDQGLRIVFFGLDA